LGSLGLLLHEVEPPLWHRHALLTKGVHLLVGIHLGRQVLVLHFIVPAKVKLDDLHGFVVNVGVLVVLQVFNLVQPLALVDFLCENVEGVWPHQLLVALPDLENVFQALHGDSDDSWVGAREELAQRRDGKKQGT